MTSDDLEQAVKIAKELEQRKATNRMSEYKPYKYQMKFHNAKAQQRLLMAGNRIGKSFSGAMEMAYHVTGLYPTWWEGKRFNRPIRAWAGGVSNETTRDVCQKELIGQPDDPSAKGTGSIPLKYIVDTIRKAGVPNALNSVIIKHVSGGHSRLGFKSYDMGKEKWMGESVDVIWLDEEPPTPIYTQSLTRTADKGGVVYMTFTPESGMTQTVAQFVNNLRAGQALITAGWDDAPHMTKKVRDQIKKFAPTAEKAAELEKDIIGNLSIMRSKWSELFSKLGGSMDAADIQTFKKDEFIKIPLEIDYDSFSGLSKEIKSKLKNIRPKTLGQALRIDGVTPAAAIILLGFIKKSRYKVSA